MLKTTRNASHGTVERVYDVEDRIFKLNCKKFFGSRRDLGNNVSVPELESRKVEEPERGDRPKAERAPATKEVISPKSKVIMEGINCSVSNVNKLCEKQLSPHQTEMVVAVDATPTRGGGLLRLPGKERTIFYYTCNWTSHFEFSDSTKFEMVNTALALEIFEPYLKGYRERYEKFVVKTDSHFFSSFKGFKDPFDVQYLLEVRDKVDSFRGKFLHTFVSQKDPDIQNADYLSRNELSLGLKILYSMVTNSTDNDASDYALVDLSAVASGHTLDVIKHSVPGKYIKGYNYA